MQCSGQVALSTERNHEYCDVEALSRWLAKPAVKLLGEANVWLSEGEYRVAEGMYECLAGIICCF